jgi:hypothetical protein
MRGGGAKLGDARKRLSIFRSGNIDCGGHTRFLIIRSAP